MIQEGKILSKKLVLAGISLILLVALFGCCTNDLGEDDNTATTTPVITLPIETQPTETTSTSPATPEFSGVSFYQEGISIVVPDCLKVEPVFVRDPIDYLGQNYCNSGQCYFNRSLQFTGYPLADTTWKAQIVIYHMPGYGGDYFQDSKTAQLGNRLIELQHWLVHEKIPTYLNYPFIPITGKNELIGTRGKLIDFQNGKGIFFLGQFGDRYDLINNADLIYTFQGLTEDSIYWVTAIFPVNYPNLPVSAEDPTILHQNDNLPDFPFSGKNEDWFSYMFNMNYELDSIPENAFTPSLSCLETMIRSLKVDVVMYD
jgi:hypothetical protein